MYSPGSKASQNIAGVGKEGTQLPEIGSETVAPRHRGDRSSESSGVANKDVWREEVRSARPSSQPANNASPQNSDIDQVLQLFNQPESSPVRGIKLNGRPQQEIPLTSEARREQAVQAVAQRKDELFSAIENNQGGNVYGFIRYRNEFPQEISSVFTQAIDKLWEKNFRADSTHALNHLPTAREILSGMASDGMSEIRQLIPLETRMRAAFLLSWPTFGLEVTKEQQADAGRFTSTIASEILLNFHEQPTEQARMSNLRTSLANDPILGRYSNSALAQSEEMRKEFLTRVSEIVATHHGMTPPPISFYSSDGELGSVPPFQHKINFNTKFDDIPESELATRLIRLAVHETRHVYQNAIMRSEYSPDHPDTKARLTAPIQIDESARLIPTVFVVDGLFLYHSVREKTGSFGGSEFQKAQAYDSNVLERDSRWAEQHAVPGYTPP